MTGKFDIDADPFTITEEMLAVPRAVEVPTPTPSPVPSGTPAPVEEAPKSKAGRKKWSLDPDVADDVHAICHRLQEHIQSRLTPGQRSLIKIDQRWERTAQLMLKKDNLTREQIEAVIDWATNDDFWSGNVRTMDGLRRHFITISMRSDFIDWARRNRRPTIAADTAGHGQSRGPVRPAMPLDADRRDDGPRGGIYEERLR